MHEGEGVHHADELMVSGIAGGAGGLHRADDDGDALVRAAGGEVDDTLVGGTELGDEDGEAERGDLRGVLAFEVADEIDEQARLLVQLCGGVDVVILDVLPQFAVGLRHRLSGEVLEAADGFAVGTVKRIAQVVRHHDVVRQEAFLRGFQCLVFRLARCVEVGEQGFDGGFHFLVSVGTGQHVRDEKEMGAVVHALKADVFDLSHCFEFKLLLTICFYVHA